MAATSPSPEEGLDRMYQPDFAPRTSSPSPEDGPHAPHESHQSFLSAECYQHPLANLTGKPSPLVPAALEIIKLGVEA